MADVQKKAVSGGGRGGQGAFGEQGDVMTLCGHPRVLRTFAMVATLPEASN